MRQGRINPTTIEQNSTGYAKLASGTTAQRPSSPEEGMTRFNTELDKLEFYNGTTWIVVDNDYRLSTITGADGQVSEPMLFIWHAARNRFISDSSTALLMFATSVYSDDYIFYDVALPADVGYIAPYNGVIVGATAYSSNVNRVYRNVSAYVGTTEYPNLLAMGSTSAVAQTVTNTDTNVPFNAGQNIRFRMRYVSGSSSTSRPMDNIMITAYIKWRIA